MYPERSWFCLFRVHQRQSVLAVCADSLFLTGLVASVWVIVQALYTAQVGFHVHGLFAGPGGAVVVKSAQNIGATCADYLVLTNAIQKLFVQQFTLLAVLMPLAVQTLIVLVWLVPLRAALMRWAIRLIVVLQSLNAMEIYFLSALLCFEFGSYTKWFSAVKGGSPGLCGPDSPVYETMGGCIYADAFFNSGGVALMAVAVAAQWVSFVYTVYTANKIGVNVLRFR